MRKSPLLGVIMGTMMGAIAPHLRPDLPALKPTIPESSEGRAKRLEGAADKRKRKQEAKELQKIRS